MFNTDQQEEITKGFGNLSRYAPGRDPSIMFAVPTQGGSKLKYNRGVIEISRKILDEPRNDVDHKSISTMYEELKTVGGVSTVDLSNIPSISNRGPIDEHHRSKYNVVSGNVPFGNKYEGYIRQITNTNYKGSRGSRYGTSLTNEELLYYARKIDPAINSLMTRAQLQDTIERGMQMLI